MLSAQSDDSATTPTKHSVLESGEPHAKPTASGLAHYSSLFKRLRSMNARKDPSSGKEDSEVNTEAANLVHDLRSAMDGLLNETTGRIVHRGSSDAQEIIDESWVQEYWGPPDLKSRSMVLLVGSQELGQQTEGEYYLIYAKGWPVEGGLPKEYVWMLVDAEGKGGKKGRIVKAGWKE